jgi:hypothetical protein
MLVSLTDVAGTAAAAAGVRIAVAGAGGVALAATAVGGSGGAVGAAAGPAQALKISALIAAKPRYRMLKLNLRVMSGRSSGHRCDNADQVHAAHAAVATVCDVKIAGRVECQAAWSVQSGGRGRPAIAQETDLARAATVVMVPFGSILRTRLLEFRLVSVEI